MNRYAFFDVDETLIYPKSMFDFLGFWYDLRLGQRGKHVHAARMVQINALATQGADRQAINRHYYRLYCGVPYGLLCDAGQAWFEDRVARGGLFKRPVVQRLSALMDAGVEPVLVSGSMFPLLTPLAAHLGIDNLLCSQLRLAGGKVTGELLKAAVGPEKKDRIAKFLRARRVSGSVCHAFGDHISDLPMLDAVAYPTVVDPCPALYEVAVAKQWPILKSQPV